MVLQHQRDLDAALWPQNMEPQGHRRNEAQRTRQQVRMQDLRHQLE